MGTNLRDMVSHREIEIASLTGWTLAVDGYNTLYQFMTTIRTATGEPLKDQQGRITSHFSGVFYRSLRLMGQGVKLVYVFDGTPPTLKRAELAERSERREEAKKKYEAAVEAHDYDAARKYGSQAVVLRRGDVDAVKPLLEAIGIPFLTAPADGEAEAAYLNATGVADAAASQDYDSLLYGARKLLRNGALSGKRKFPGGGYKDIKPEIVEPLLSREQMVDIAILIGNDFNEGVTGIGPTRALKLVKQHGKLESIPDVLPQVPTYAEVRDIFLHPQVAPFAPEWGQIDAEKVKRILVDEHSFSEERVMSAVNAATPVDSDLTKWT